MISSSFSNDCDILDDVCLTDNWATDVAVIVSQVHAVSLMVIVAVIGWKQQLGGVDSDGGGEAVWGRPAHPLLTPFLSLRHTKTPLAGGEMEGWREKEEEERGWEEREEGEGEGREGCEEGR